MNRPPPPKTETENEPAPKLVRRAVAGPTRAVVAWSGWPDLGDHARLGHAGVVVAALALLCMAVVDRPLAWSMKAQVQGDMLALWEGITDLGVATGYVVAAVLVLLVGWMGVRVAAHESTRRRCDILRRYAALLLGGLALSGAVVNLTKIVLGRQRPEYLFRDGFYGFEPLNFDTGANTFPSGHAQTIWVVAAVLCIAFPRHRLAICAVAAVVALSRVVITEHYLSDVLVGSYLGIASVVLLAPLILRREAPASR